MPTAQQTRPYWARPTGKCFHKVRPEAVHAERDVPRPAGCQGARGWEGADAINLGVDGVDGLVEQREIPNEFRCPISQEVL